MKSVGLSFLAIFAFLLFSCQPVVVNDVPSKGGVLGEIQTVNDTESTIKAWGEAKTPQLAKEQAILAAAKKMAEKPAGNKLNTAVAHSGWKGIVDQTCTADDDRAATTQKGATWRWEGIIKCQRQELLKWLEQNNLLADTGIGTETIPKIAIMPKRVFGETENLELTENENACFVALRELLRKRDSRYQVDDYETIIRGWKGNISAEAGDINLSQMFAIVADIYIQFTVSVKKAGNGMIQANCLLSAVFVSTGKSAADHKGVSQVMQDNPANRDAAIADAAKNGIDAIYDQMLNEWNREAAKGFHYRIIIKGVDDDAKEKIYIGLNTVKGKAPITQNTYKNGVWDISFYAKNADPIMMRKTINDGIKPLGYKVKTISEKYHALVYQLEKE